MTVKVEDIRALDNCVRRAFHHVVSCGHGDVVVSYLLPIRWVADSFAVSAVMTATAPASSGLVFVVLGGSNNHFFCQMALVIASVSNDVILAVMVVTATIAWVGPRQRRLFWQ